MDVLSHYFPISWLGTRERNVCDKLDYSARSQSGDWERDGKERDGKERDGNRIE